MQINVSLVSGKTTQVSLHGSCSVHDLKKKIERIWGIDPEDQMIVSGTQAVAEMESIASLATALRTVDVTVIISEMPNAKKLEELILSIGASEDAPSRYVAIADLARLVHVSNDRELCFTLDGLRSLIRGPSSLNGKRGGLEALAELAPTGHGSSIAIACQMLKNNSAFVRSTAATTVARLAPRGHEYALTEVLKIVRESRPVVQVDALACLGEIAPKKCEDESTFDLVMKLLAWRMEHDDLEVRTAAADAVTRML